ncbi:hypothetical protein SAMN05216428_12032 [Nitrosospira sp. Nsp11]|uniref:hypothetical protein n=1 Tax=Nitrosospira sp. Nsp11 TaxID=1855338 RepID=UPI00091F589F|nr:hypothetical protein [Nitrosospira sp. Nsp11]SHM27561.1 hypothetical protein SAMN05216428_12032 [Nitrosospira sp. Nsp11]
MSNNFEDIKIVSLNDKLSVSADPKSEQLMYIVFDLSSPAPGKWADYFNSRWSSKMYGFDRTANVSGERLKIRCTPDELKKELLAALKHAITQANSYYHEMLDSHQKASEAQAAKVERQKAQLAELKKNLTFD